MILAVPCSVFIQELLLHIHNILHLHSGSIISTCCQLSRENVLPWTHYSKTVACIDQQKQLQGEIINFKVRSMNHWIDLLDNCCMRGTLLTSVSHDCTTSYIFLKYILNFHKLCILGHCNTKGAGKGLFQHLLYSQQIFWIQLSLSEKRVETIK